MISFDTFFSNSWLSEYGCEITYDAMFETLKSTCTYQVIHYAIFTLDGMTVLKTARFEIISNHDYIIS